MPNQLIQPLTQMKPLTIENKVVNILSIDCLVEEYYAYVRRLAEAILCDAHEADDATQETFIAANRALAGYRGEAHARTWLTAIVVNTCRGRLRKRKVRQTLENILTSLHILSERPPSPEEAAIEEETNRTLWKVVDELEDKHRLPVLLRYVQEMTIPEIAEILGMKEGTVHSRLHYARQKIMDRLGDCYPGEEVKVESDPS
jgi:RNA polymerase sigma-70 factor, ECF subfamily